MLPHKTWPHTQLIAQGAEARIYKVESQSVLGFQSPQTDDPFVVFKHRLPKAYRHPQLDEKLLSSRLVAESKCYLRALSAGIEVPYVWRVEKDGIWLEHVDGWIVRRVIDGDISESNTSQPNWRAQCLTLCERIGLDICRMHANDLVHGDLTTSNIMVRRRNTNSHQQLDWDRVVFIDFGLAFVSTSLEDKGVDLYVLERAILSLHANASELFEAILRGYRRGTQFWDKVEQVITQYESVRQRGRKRDMIG